MKLGLKRWSIKTNLIDQTIHHPIDENVFNYIELDDSGQRDNPFLIDTPYIIYISHEKEVRNDNVKHTKYRSQCFIQ